MKENKYDDPAFFEEYSRMGRSQEGLAGAGEWHVLQKMLPGFAGRRVLDLGCGFGWHCQYVAEQGAAYVLGIDISEKMLEVARAKNRFPEVVEYRRIPVEDYDYPAGSYDVVLSSLTLHYIPSFGEICRQVNRCLTAGGAFVFSVEHPVFTAYGSQEWYTDGNGNRLHWPLDRYFEEGVRTASFLGGKVTKYHHTLTTFLNELLKNGFEIREVAEPEPAPAMLDNVPGMRDELRRPIFLILSARKIR